MYNEEFSLLKTLKKISKLIDENNTLLSKKKKI